MVCGCHYRLTLNGMLRLTSLEEVSIDPLEIVLVLLTLVKWRVFMCIWAIDAELDRMDGCEQRLSLMYSLHASTILEAATASEKSGPSSREY